MELRKRFYVALAIYAAFGLAIWLLIDDIPVLGSLSQPWSWNNPQLTLRRLTLAILAMFVVRTVLHWRAEEIRAEKERNQVSS
jgi:hypothetical protein